MKTNQTPHYDASHNATGCCPRFNPKGWDGQHLVFKDKRFVRATTRSFFHIPLNMGKVFGKTYRAIEGAKAMKMDQSLVLSEDLSPWREDHYFAVKKDVPGQEMVTLSGRYLTRVFEGPFSRVEAWCKVLKASVENEGKIMGRTFFYYTTCPNCAKAYGKNFVIGVAEIK